MEIQKNFALFREFIKNKHRFACIYANTLSQFNADSQRRRVFKIKSDLAHDFDKDEDLYIPINLWRTISRIFKDYVIGMWFNVDFNNPKENEEFVKISDTIQLQLKLNSAIETQSSIWYSILRLRGVDVNWKLTPRVELIPLPNYVANMEWLGIGDTFEDIKEHFIYSINKTDKNKKYLYVDRYEKQEDWTWKGYFWEKWEYNKDFAFKNRFEEWVEETLDFLPLYIFNNDLENPHSVDETIANWILAVWQKGYVWDIPKYFNQSDYVDLADLFEELNDRESQISIEYIKNLASKISVPASFFQWLQAQALRKKSWDKVFAENPDFIVHNAWETPAQYIIKDVWYVQSSINDYIPFLLKLISSISTVPTVLLANALYWANNPVGTTEKEFQPFYSRVEAKQLKIYNQLQRLFKDIMSYYWYDNDELPTIRFKKPATYDVGERTQTAVMQMNAWIMSKESAIAYTMGYDSTEVQEELDKINKETTEAYKRDWNYKDFFNDEEEENDLNSNETNNE